MEATVVEHLMEKQLELIQHHQIFGVMEVVAYMNHGGYTRTVSVSGCSAYATFRSGIESSSTFGQYVFNYSEGSIYLYNLL